MPSKLTKAQKKIARKNKDISALIAKHKVEAALTAPTDDKPKLPMLQVKAGVTRLTPLALHHLPQAFVKGNVGELHGTVNVKYASYDVTYNQDQ